MQIHTPFQKPASVKHSAPLVGTGLAAASAVLVLSGALSTAAQATPSGPALAQQYLAALKPAGAAISTAEARLERLPVTATLAQVQAAVAPLPKALAQLETLSSSTSPSPSTAGTTLQALGKPEITGSDGAGPAYGTPASGARLVVGSVEYQSGFQLTSPANYWGENGAESAYASYNWHIVNRYTVLTAMVGYDLSNACKGSYIRILGNHSAMLPFAFKGKVMEGMDIPPSGLAQITVDIAGEADLTVQTNFTCGGSYNGSNRSVIDFINDHLSS